MLSGPVCSVWPIAFQWSETGAHAITLISSHVLRPIRRDGVLLSGPVRFRVHHCDSRVISCIGANTHIYWRTLIDNSVVLL